MREFRTLSKPSAAPALLRLPRVTPPMTRLRPHAAPIAVAALTVVGLVLRVELFGESLLADELSTRWIVSTNGLAGVWSTVHTDAEITPPLFFVLSWFGDQLYDAPEMVRLPSLVAGLASIPLIYLWDCAPSAAPRLDRRGGGRALALHDLLLDGGARLRAC